MDGFVKSRGRALLYAGWAIAIGVFLALAVDSLIAAPNKDLSAFIYVAQGIPDGQMPYVDRWDHKGPLTYLLTLVGISISGAFGIWLLGVTFLAGSTWFAFRACREAYGAAAAAISCALFLIAFAKFADDGGLTEHYAMLFQFMALFLFLRIGRRGGKHDALLCLAIGALGAAAFLLRANLIGVWLAIGLYWVTQLERARKWMLWSIAGGLSVLAVAAFILVVAGMWGASWSAVILYNLGHSDATLWNRLGVLRDLRGEMLLLSLPLAAGWCAGLWYLVSGKARGKSFEGVLPLTLILCPIEVALVTTSGYQFNHYYLALLPAFTLMIAFFAWFVADQRLVAPMFLTVALLFSVIYYSTPSRNIAGNIDGFVDKYAHIGEITSSGAYSNVARRVQEATEPGDSILSWGNQSIIYVLSKRDAPTRFFTQFPLINLHYANEHIRNEFISDVVSNRPAMIIDTGDGRLPPLDVAERREWDPSGRRYLEAEHYQEFFDFVESEYEVVEEIGRATIYGLRGREW